jgi:hypothetical protein
MKGTTKGILAVAFVLFAIIGVLAIAGKINLFPQQAFSSTFTPVYCNNYEFTCCVPNNNEVQKVVSGTEPYQCPETGLGCKVTYVDTSYLDGVQVSHGIGNCAVKGWWVFQSFSCDTNEATNKIKGVADINLAKGEFVWSNSGTRLSVTNLDQKLVFSGRAGSTQGADIKTGSCVYDLSAGEKITDQKGGSLGSTTSYTVPQNQCLLSWQSGDRFICGNLEEQCSVNADCGGHTYGNKECYGRTLQTYGCTQIGAPKNLVKEGSVFVDPALNTNRLPETFYTGQTSRCEIQSAQPVQCCGDTDCGSNAFCDKNTFTCKQKVECSKATDCGVSVQCDFASKQLKTPACTSGKCAFTTKSVDCCSDVNCPTGQFCSQDNKCAEKPVVKTACILECCQSDPLYFDKLCPAGQFCSGHVCGSTPECTKDSECKTNELCKDQKCIAQEQLVCEDKFFGTILASKGVKEDCGFWCKVGLKSPEKINVCVYDKTPLILIIASIVTIIGFAFFSGKKGKKKGGQNVNRADSGGIMSGDDAIWKNKYFWLALGALALIGFVTAFWVYIFWTVVILIVLYFVFSIIGFKFKKLW